MCEGIITKTLNDRNMITVESQNIFGLWCRFIQMWTQLSSNTYVTRWFLSTLISKR